MITALLQMYSINSQSTKEHLFGISLFDWLPSTETLQRNNKKKRKLESSGIFRSSSYFYEWRSISGFHRKVWVLKL